MEEPERPDQVDFEGVYQCHFCDEKVYRAVYLPEEKILTWKCSNGHKSFLEKFSIG
jgi:hypothetical protein